MARNKTREKILDKFRYLQEGNDEPIWISGTQVTELLNKENPSSVRMALLLLVEEGEIVRERRAGRGKTGRTGQSAWYALARINAQAREPENNP